MPPIPAARHLNFPTSVTADADGRLYIAESGLPFGGAPEGGIVSQVNPDGTVTPMVRGLRAPVNGVVWHSGGLIISGGGNPVIGPDGKLYFSQGGMTNSGVVGLDSGDLPWLGTI